MTPRQFLDVVCEPNVGALLATHDDYRLAVNAILSLDAAVGILHAKLQKAGASVPTRDTDFRTDIGSRVQKYSLLRDTAFSLKHGALEGKTPRLVSHHYQIAQSGVPFGHFAFGRDTFGGKTIFIEKNDGTRERAADVVMVVLTELDQVFASHGE